VEIPAQRETLQTLLTFPADYLNPDKVGYQTLNHHMRIAKMASQMFKSCFTV
jgi:hypothetical protein